MKYKIFPVPGTAGWICVYKLVFKRQCDLLNKFKL